MKVKKFLAANMQEAMQQIKNDLGKDAVILSSKHVYKGGILGFFAKKRLKSSQGMIRILSSGQCRHQRRSRLRKSFQKPLC